MKTSTMKKQLLAEIEIILNMENLKLEAEKVMQILATIDHPEFTHLNQLGKAGEIEYKEHKHTSPTLTAKVKLNISQEWANLFHEVFLVVRFRFEGEKILGGTVEYDYEHSTGGSNGHDLCRFTCGEKIEVQYQRKEYTGKFGCPEYNIKTHKITI